MENIKTYSLHTALSHNLAFIVFIAILGGACFAIPCNAQVITDSLANDFRTFAAKHFSRYRTVNAFWETKGTHNYTFETAGKEVEKRKKKNLHTLKFSTMVPILKLKHISFYANLQYSHYQFHTCDNDDKATSSVIFLRNAYDYFNGGLNGSYYTELFKKPLIISASVSADVWNEGSGKVYGTISAMMVLRNNKHTNFSIGIMGMTLFNTMPVLPIVVWWHRFDNPSLSIEVSTGQFYLRYQKDKQRISAGAAMGSENFYLHSYVGGSLETYYYCDAVLKPEIQYEYIINKRLYLTAHAGLSMVMKGRLYKKNRKGIKVTDADTGKTEVEAIVKQDRSPVPFFNVGISYSLFK